MVARNKWKMMLVDFGFARALEGKEVESQKKHLRNSIALEKKKTQPPPPVQKAIQASDAASNDGSDTDDMALIEQTAAALRNHTSDEDDAQPANAMNRVSYVSNLDVHDTRYDHLQITATVKSILDTSDETGTRSGYTGMPLADFECPVTIRISPTKKNEGMYLSNDPVIFAVGAGLIFFLTGGLFLFYDYLVDRGRIVYT